MGGWRDLGREGGKREGVMRNGWVEGERDEERRREQETGWMERLTEGGGVEGWETQRWTDWWREEVPWMMDEVELALGQNALLIDHIDRCVLLLLLGSSAPH